MNSVFNLEKVFFFNKQHNLVVMAEIAICCGFTVKP